MGEDVSEHEESRSRRRSLSSAELTTWRAFVEVAGSVRRVLEVELLTESGISSTDYAVMLALSEAEDRELRSSTLAERIGWERSRLSHQLRRMEQRELVSRRRVGDDARSAAVTLTRTGTALLRRASATHLRLVREVFIDAFDQNGLAAVRAVSDTLRTHLNTRVETAVPTETS